jgi:hypothetical protein
MSQAVLRKQRADRDELVTEAGHSTRCSSVTWPAPLDRASVRTQAEYQLAAQDQALHQLAKTERITTLLI